MKGVKKLLILVFILNLIKVNAYSTEPDVFVQSTVNRASEILSKDISKEENVLQILSECKIDKNKFIDGIKNIIPQIQKLLMV